VAIVAIFFADVIYRKQPLTRKGHDKLQASADTRWIFNLANAKLYWDEFYGWLIEQPYNRASKWFADTLDWAFWHDYVHNTLIAGGFNGLAEFFNNPVDKGIIDRGFLDIGAIVQWFGGRLRRSETGYVRTYAFTVLLGVLFVLIVILFPLIRQVLH
jgi:NADH-quinone oxidoreductase subunit L